MKLNEDGKYKFLRFICLLTFPLFAECGNVRLWPSKCSGRVEVFHSGRWGTVCDDGWRKANSEVVCREVGCGHVVRPIHSAHPGSGSIWLDDVTCNGNESSIVDCEHKPFGENNCDHSEDAGVMCSDGIRLANGTNRCTGIVQVYRNADWGVVCNRNWNQNISNALCKKLECGLPMKTGDTGLDYMGYISSCAANQTSISECGMTKSSERCYGVHLQCEGAREIRLMNGTDRCSGRVEMFVENRWGTVCDDDWDMKDAQVVCQAMNCGAPLKAPHSAYFGRGEGQIWLDNVNCAGNESGLMQCRHNTIGDHNCGHSEDASVVCESQIRLVNGTTSCSGRVEFARDNTWVSARRSSWGKNEASVVCRQMNCGESVSFSGSNSPNEPSKMYDVTCFGNETSLKKCAIKQSNETSGLRSEDATVVCTGEIILSDGPNRCAGRVEVFHKDQWADICSDSWDMIDAAVVCNQLKCGTPHKLLTSTGRAGTTLWVNETNCFGGENKLSFCRHKFTNQTCTSPTVAGIICSEGLVVRLGSGQDRCSGRVEIRRQDQWGTLCDLGWNLDKANVVCDLLECGHAVNTSSRGTYPQGTGLAFDATDTCFTNMNAIHKCSANANGFRASACGHDKDAALVCGGDSSIRLVNGSDRCSGRVEILYRAQWGTVCDDNWDLRDAEVVCRAKDCGSPVAAVPSAFFGRGQGPVWLDDLECRGNESSLLKCRQAFYGNGNCGHGEDAGIICSAHMRLINSEKHCMGNVEVFYNGEWLPTVSNGWGRNEAAVVCREMNCGDPVSVTETFSQAELQRGYKVRCTGRESAMSQCTVTSYNEAVTERLRYAAVTCSGIVRLSDGPNRCAGRAEVFHNGLWGKVCGMSWDMSDAQVVCQQLGCGDAYKVTTEPDYGGGMGDFLVEHIECNGRESILQQCMVRHGGKDCNDTSVAGVICSDSLGIRLVDGPDRCSGRVEVRMGSVWGSLCTTDWDVPKAEIACELLECGHAVNVSNVQHRGTTPKASPPQSCYSSPQSLQHCLHRGLQRETCAQNSDAAVTCGDQIRLVGGPNSCSGRVEVLHKGQWGTVCDDDWGVDDAQVVCRQMGCGTPVSAPSGARFGRGSGPTWLDNVHCIGSESTITQCTHNGWGDHNCGHEEDAGVVCLDTLQKPRLLMSPGTEVNWGDRLDITCAAVTQHRGVFTLRKNNDTFKMEQRSESEAATFTFQKVNFTQEGFYYCEYKKNLSREVVFYPPGVALQLKVTVTLEKPDILVTSHEAMVTDSKYNRTVVRGQSFNITCSVHSRYPGGVFYLSKAKLKVSGRKPAVHRSNEEVADFIFPKAEFSHDGEYRCLYKVNMSSRHFESEASNAIQIIVKTNSSSVAVRVVLSLLMVAVVLVVMYFLWKKQKLTTISDTVVTSVYRIRGVIEGKISGRTKTTTTVPDSFSNEVYLDRTEENPVTLYADNEPLVLTT